MNGLVLVLVGSLCKGQIILAALAGVELLWRFIKNSDIMPNILKNILKINNNNSITFLDYKMPFYIKYLFKIFVSVGDL